MLDWMCKKYTALFNAVFLFFLLGCGDNEDDLAITLDTPICIESLSSCSNKVTGGNVSLLFDREKVISESEFTLHLTYQGVKKLNSIHAYIEGKNMFMGKIPLVFSSDTSNTGNYIAKGQLGSCTNDEMVWNVVIVLEYTMDSENVLSEETTLFEFTSYK